MEMNALEKRIAANVRDMYLKVQENPETLLEVMTKHIASAACMDDYKAMQTAEKILAGVQAFEEQMNKPISSYYDYVKARCEEANCSEEETRSICCKHLGALILHLAKLQSEHWDVDEVQSQELEEIKQAISGTLENAEITEEKLKEHMDSLFEASAQTHGVMASEQMADALRSQIEENPDAEIVIDPEQLTPEAVRLKGACYAAALYTELPEEQRETPEAVGFVCARDTQLVTEHLRYSAGLINRTQLEERITCIGGVTAGAAAAYGVLTHGFASVAGVTGAVIEACGGGTLATACGVFVGGGAAISTVLMGALAFGAVGLGVAALLHATGVSRKASDVLSNVGEGISGLVKGKQKNTDAAPQREAPALNERAAAALKSAKSTFKERVINPCKAAAGRFKNWLLGKNPDNDPDKVKNKNPDRCPDPA